MIDNKSNKPFLDHLEELRSRIIKCFMSIIFFSIIGYMYSNSIISFLIKPVEELNVSFQVLKITSIFLIKIGLAIICGILFSLPVILYQFLVFLLLEMILWPNRFYRYHKLTIELSSPILMLFL